MTNEESALLSHIKALIAAKRYRIRVHAVHHMIEEGFSEENLIDAVLGRSRTLEDYPEEHRSLVFGFFRLSGKVRCPLHVVCDYSNPEVVDIVTAYIPEKPWWTTPTKRGRQK
jgi:hypothetical protein